MKVSLNTIKQFTDVNVPVDELIAKINQQLGGVEEVANLGERYKDAVIAKVNKCEKHPNADKLSVCEIDAGTGENVQVVCGAPNVREGIFVVWLPPNSTVPSTFEDKEPFVLEPKELRGVISNGMLASAKELGIGDSHDGILEINPDEWKPNDTEIKPGANFAAAYGLDDTIIDIENKMFTHRPDLFGQIGVAREIAGIQHNQFTSPDWYKNAPEFKSGDGLELTIVNDASNVVPRFMSVAIKNVEVKPSPLWLQIELVRLGGKPINNIVDVTNYIMLFTAQPTHAYDYDKLRGHKLGTRMATKNENVTLLNGKSYTLDESDIVIVDGEGVVGLGGIMGGGNSEVSSETKNIVLEVANFDMYTVRKTSMRYGLFTDALTRFNKGQSPLQNSYILNLLMVRLRDIAGGEQASDVFDDKTEIKTSNAVSVTASFINQRLGLELEANEIRQLLENTEIVVSGDGGMSIEPPFWRTDLGLPEDIVEEVGRLYGFDKLPRELPVRTTKPSPKNNARIAKQAVRESLSRIGASEVVTYSFVNEKVMKKAEQDASQAYKLSNALSPDLQYYRLSVLPSLLDKVYGNIRAGYDEFSLFEIGKGHNKNHVDDDNLPGELEFVDFIYTSKISQSGAAYFHVKRMVEQLLADFGEPAPVFTVIEKPMDFPVTSPFDQSRSAIVTTTSGEFIGMIGELKGSVRRNFKLPAYSSAATLDMDGLQKLHDTSKTKYQPLSRYPAVDRDVCFSVPVTTSYQEFIGVAHDSLNNKIIEATLSPSDIYQADGSDRKHITLAISLQSHDKTLTGEEATSVVDALVAHVTGQLDAKLV